MAKGLFGALRSIDAFGKTTEDVKVKTRTGAFLTLISAAIILTFMMIEFVDYRTVNIDTSIVVDRSRGEKLTVSMNITFPRVPCYLLSLDVMDISGELQRDISHNIHKSRLDPQGKEIPSTRSSQLKNQVDKVNEQRKPGYCGSCYGGLAPASGCCQSCEDVRQAYVGRGWSFGDPDTIEQCVQEGWSTMLKEQSSEGCNTAGRLRVNKVVGSVHLSPGSSFQMGAGHNIYDLVPYLRDDGNRHDFSHFVHRFAFESDDEYDVRKSETAATMRKRMSIDYNPLDGAEGKTSQAQYMFQYFIKVVSTQFNVLGQSDPIRTHQYSVTHFERDLAEGGQGRTAQGTHVSHGISGIPGAFFNFEISPLLVVHAETRQSFAHFLTSTCAIVGGVLTVASLVDSLLFVTERAFKKGSSQPFSSGKAM